MTSNNTTIAQELQDQGAWVIGTDIRHHARETADQIQSYNQNFALEAPGIIEDAGRAVVEDDDRKFQLQFTDVRICKPTAKEQGKSEEIHDIYPAEARLRKRTYGGWAIVNARFHQWDRRKGETEMRLNDKESKTYTGIAFAKLPVMIKSMLDHETDLRHEDRNDPGGYFIIRGQEKVLIGQNRVRTNIATVRALNKYCQNEYKCEIRSGHNRRLRASSTMFIFQTRPRGKHATYYAVLPFQTKLKIPVAALFRILGLSSEDDMLYAIFRQRDLSIIPKKLIDFAKAALDWQSVQDFDQEALLTWIMTGCRQKRADQPRTPELQKQIDYLRHIINTEMLPHVGVATSGEEENDGSGDKENDGTSQTDADTSIERRKVFFLGITMRKMIRIANGLQAPDVIDEHRFKRVIEPGALLALQLRQQMRVAMKQIEGHFRKALRDKKAVNVLDVILAAGKRVNNAIRYAFSTGNWGMQNIGESQTGFVQQLSRTSRAAYLSHLRRNSTAVNRDGKQAEPRQLPAGHWGAVCPVETPEGGSCGLLNAPPWASHISLAYEAEQVMATLLTIPGLKIYQPLQSLDDDHGVFLYINGSICLVSTSLNAADVIARVKDKIGTGELPFDIGVAAVPDLDGVEVTCDGGISMRPVVYVPRLWDFIQTCRNLRKLKQDARILSELLHRGIIGYVDKHEDQTLRIASMYRELEPEVLRQVSQGQNPATSRFQAVELDITSTLFGVCASMIVLPNHNQTPRNIYQSAMSKQTAGHSMDNMDRRMDTKMLTLDYPQKPLVSAIGGKWVMEDEYPGGVNAVVLVQSFPYTDEDGIVLSQGSVDRGMFRVTNSQVFTESVKNVNSDTEEIARPGKNVKGRTADFGDSSSYLGTDGLAECGTYAQPGQPLIGKIITTNRPELSSTPIQRDRSAHMRPNEGGQVAQVMLSVTKEEHRMASVKVKSSRPPQIGDKMSSRHGQKGVISMIVPQEDMPRTHEGITPDLIVNPHSWSRMTVAQKYESSMGMVASLTGKRQDGTAFSNPDVIKIGDDWFRFGYARRFTMPLWNGRTGEMIRNPCFFGIVTIQRLHHMVQDKGHVRPVSGMNSSKTRQPVSGRKRDGGLRFGEMERDVTVTHGAAGILKDRLHDCSDATLAPICPRCGFDADRLPESHREKLQYIVTRGIAEALPDDAFGYCVACRASFPYGTEISYAKLELRQQLAASGIKMPFKLEIKERESQLPSNLSQNDALLKP